VAGEVLERNLNPGAEVRPDDPNPLFVISDLRHVWLTASLYPRDLALVHAGDRVRFTTDAIPGRAFDARVTWVSNDLDPQTRTAALRAEIDNVDGALRAQVPGELRVMGAAREGRAVVPTSALITHGADVEVIVEVGSGHFRRRSVQVGEDDGVSVTLLSGMNPGERVVTRGGLLLAAEMDKEHP
jgi:cobalt-zinc-cadmium efflux system membrane fusion protein